MQKKKKIQNSLSFLDLVQKRSTNYLYDKKPISGKFLDKILESGRFSPSCSNSQPWHFIVIKNPQTISLLSKTVKFGAPPEGKEPPLAIAVVFDKSKSSLAPICKVTDESGYEEGLMSVAMAAYSMVLEATDLGLASALLSPIQSQASPILGLSQDDVLPFILFIGYSAKGVPPRLKLRRILSESVSYEQKGKK